MEKCRATHTKSCRRLTPTSTFRIANWLSKTVAKSLYRVRIGYVDSDNLFSIKQDDSIVLVMNHRSNMDYILLSYVASEYATLSYAVGEWRGFFRCSS